MLNMISFPNEQSQRNYLLSFMKTRATSNDNFIIVYKKTTVVTDKR